MLLGFLLRNVFGFGCLSELLAESFGVQVDTPVGIFALLFFLLFKLGFKGFFGSFIFADFGKSSVLKILLELLVILFFIFLLLHLNLILFLDGFFIHLSLRGHFVLELSLVFFKFIL